MGDLDSSRQLCDMSSLCMLGCWAHVDTIVSLLCRHVFGPINDGELQEAGLNDAGDVGRKADKLRIYPGILRGSRLVDQAATTTSLSSEFD